jgi:hypothetical protein
MERSRGYTATGYGPDVLRSIERDDALAHVRSTDRAIQRRRDLEARGDASMSALTDDAREIILGVLKEAMGECAKGDDFDAMEYIVSLMRQVHEKK